MMNRRIQNSEVRSQIFIRAVVLCSLFSVLCSLFSVACYADTVPSTALINNAIQHDGKTVVYEGEVIGDVMARGEYCWLNVNDGSNAIGIWVDKDLAKNIIFTGGYMAKGDVVKVTGVFHRACLEHGGDLDIHAVSLHKILIGGNFHEKVSIGKRNFIIVLLVVLCLVWILTLLKRK